ncbi:unnamed protein product [Cyprideis torosa]|uniref:Uncharacterized protein n=1 Tax=Cyprideis torosa TaxID=163714 RepID=A0A7R8WAA1_9CRUS|nr:unnamed protein product [Cyprideis torosa]CAG0890763.1 unnamed protein product [Cyprideis torosa]
MTGSCSRFLAILLLVSTITVTTVTTLFIPKKVITPIDKCCIDAEHITGVEGSNITLRCGSLNIAHDPATVPPFVIYWERKDEPHRPIFIHYEDYPSHIDDAFAERLFRAPDSEGVASIVITSLRPADAGWYKCYIRYLNRPPDHEKPNATWIHLDVYPQPELLHFHVAPPTVVYVRLGSSQVLSCDARGTEAPEVWWTRNGSTLLSTTTGQRHHIGSQGTELILTHIRREDLGRYTCHANNSEATIQTMTFLREAQPARITKPPQDTRIAELTKLEWPCGAMGEPGNLTWSWLKNGIPIRAFEWTGRTVVDTLGTLTINPVQASDAGEYECTVTNGIGGKKARVKATLNVEFPARVPTAPTLQYLPKGLLGIIHCPAEANPPVDHVLWTKDGESMNPYVYPQKYIQHNNGSLTVRDTAETDRGYYRCKPYNRLGSGGISPLIHVRVVKAPDFVQEPKSIYRVIEGDTLEVPCVSDSRGWRAKWWKEDSLETTLMRTPHNVSNDTDKAANQSGDWLVKDEGVIRIENVTLDNDGEIYICSIESPFGDKTVRIRLKVGPREPFQMITEVRGAPGGGEILLAHPSHNISDLAISRYQYVTWVRIDDEEHEDGEWTPLTLYPGHEKSFEFYGLDSGRRYRILLQAISPQENGKVYEKEYQVQTTADRGKPQDHGFEPPLAQALTSTAGKITRSADTGLTLWRHNALMQNFFQKLNQKIDDLLLKTRKQQTTN